MGAVVIKNLIKQFDDVTALNNVNLDIQEGEFFALLGPSGCGKTTTMRCVAGFESPTSGEIRIGDQVVNKIPPNRRNCGMVFQSYALFPHLSVFENVAYGLNIKEFYQNGFLSKAKVLAGLLNRKLAKCSKEVERKVKESLEYVELEPYTHRLPSELSGGQQQRVALARALVMEPAVLLMDEPLSNLDKKLRNTMRTTIRRIQQDVGITTIFVTHDQEEAMSMADRVAVMSGGQVEQVASPTELYSHPRTSLIADFVGSSNIMRGDVKEKYDDRCVVRCHDFALTSHLLPKKDNVEVIIRPENIQIHMHDTPVNGENVLDGSVTLSTYLGPTIRYDVKVGNTELIVDVTYESGVTVLQPGTRVKLSIDPEKVLLI